VGIVGASLVGIALVGLAVLVARPTSTEQIVDADGQPVPGSIAELTSVEVDGHELGLMIRGRSTDNPVVLFLAGGPGGAERGAMRNHLEALEDSFTVATWDQRGTGASYPALDPTDTLTLDGEVAATIDVTNYLRDRFDQDQIYLIGQSWGSLLGVLSVQAAPDLYRAYVGTGQMVSPVETDRIFYEDSLAWAEETGRDGLRDQLRSIGPPPYEEMLDYETALSYEHEVYPYDHSGNSEGAGGFSENFLVPEYSLTDQVHLLGAFMDTFSVLYPQIQGIDLRDTATDLAVPMYFVQGAHEADGRTEPFAEWYELLDAPIKELVALDTSGHRPLFEQPGEFSQYLEQTVLPQTSPR
jgi:pimeloyl-ACP methyl ester carboxylesterase